MGRERDEWEGRAKKALRGKRNRWIREGGKFLWKEVKKGENKGVGMSNEKKRRGRREIEEKE